jgi:penicillin-binding protein 1B
VLLAAALLLVALPAAMVAYYYVKFARRIDAKLAAGPFSTTVNLFAAPEIVAVGDPMTAPEIAARLRRAGYGASETGWFKLEPGRIEIFPGRQSYFAREPAVIQIADGKISRIASLTSGVDFPQYQLEPEFITNISGKQRAKRRLVRFPQIPPALVRAVISVEDKHFFRHSGFDFLRILKAAYVDVREGRKEQGASTLSMQLTRSLWLDPRKNWRRKLSEFLMTVHLEERLSKEEIFETYANQIYLGRRGTFNINGFGEGARVFFGKEIGRLTLPEAATLAGMVQRPAWFNPLRHPKRARDRRNVVLWLMRQNGYIGEDEYKTAAASPLIVAGPSGNLFDVESQYFLDLVNDELQSRFGEQEIGARQVYTTLDWRLQRAANEAVRTALARVDATLRKNGAELPPNQPQVALVAIDPRTGEIKAFVGGRDYAASQIDHALAERQPGSIFKPFVYAAALDTAVNGGTRILTPATVVVDQPTTFIYANQTYAPDNFRQRFLGTVSLRRALVQSLNVATVKAAELTGYDRVAAMAHSAGLRNAAPTPAVALGAYEQNALEMAGAYTVFANQGLYVAPTGISMVRSPGGKTLYRHQPEQRPVLDTRVAWLVTNMMQDVLRNGTGKEVRRLGFNLPAAGKTGTSRDGWFAGFTGNLLCVVWVGFDDHRDLELEGARSALPIWTEFMNRAAELRDYGNVRDFPAPPGIVRVAVCPASGQRAALFCPSEFNEAFIDGTQPASECRLHNPPQQYADRQIVFPQVILTPEPAAAPVDR